VIYGLYLSATGIATASHQQDVIANNIANAETGGFKRTMAVMEQRRVESQVMQAAGLANPLFDKIGGGQLHAPTYVDFSQGEVEQSSNNFDTAVLGDGFIAVQDKGELRLTRAGSMMLDREGNLITLQGHKVLGTDKNPIKINGYQQHELSIGEDGTITHNNEALAKIGLLDSPTPQLLKPVGQSLLKPVGDAQLVPASGKLMRNMSERANVDPTIELTRLMEAQRLLETNANMIKYQDATLGKLVSEVGKIG